MMKQETPIPLMSYWYQALSSPLGIELICSDSAHTRQRLYATRNEARDVELEALSVCISPFDPSRLWILKRTEKNEAP